MKNLLSRLLILQFSARPGLLFCVFKAVRPFACPFQKDCEKDAQKDREKDAVNWANHSAY